MRSLRGKYGPIRPQNVGQMAQPFVAVARLMRPNGR